MPLKNLNQLKLTNRSFSSFEDGFRVVPGVRLGKRKLRVDGPAVFESDFIKKCKADVE